MGTQQGQRNASETHPAAKLGCSPSSQLGSAQLALARVLKGKEGMEGEWWSGNGQMEESAWFGCWRVLPASTHSGPVAKQALEEQSCCTALERFRESLPSSKAKSHGA